MRPHEGNYDVDCPADSNYCGDSDEEEDPERLLDVWLGELDSLASVNVYDNDTGKVSVELIIFLDFFFFLFTK